MRWPIVAGLGIQSRQTSGQGWNMTFADPVAKG
jgi:hypothetical protein